MEIVDIDVNGVVTIRFSDQMIVPLDINRLQEKELYFNDEKKSNLELFVTPLEG